MPVEDSDPEEMRPQRDGARRAAPIQTAPDPADLATVGAVDPNLKSAVRVDRRENGPPPPMKPAL